MLPQYMALSVSQLVTFVKKKFVCPFIGLHCGCVHPSVCVRSIDNTVGASRPRACPFIGRQSSLDPCMLPTPLYGNFYCILYIRSG